MKPSTDTTINKHKNAKAMMITSMAIFGTLGIFTRNIAVTSGEPLYIGQYWLFH